MNAELNQWIDKSILKLVSKHYQNPLNNIFDMFMETCQQYYERPVHNLTELRRAQSTKLKGDIFEHFALKYLKEVYGLMEVWLLRDLPETERLLLKLKTNDVGIDLIGQDNQGRYYAIQAKYRRANRYKKTMGLSWKTLSTFYALVTRTGPYHRHVIITNANYARHIGKKTKQDLSICLARLRNTPVEKWLPMTGNKGVRLADADSYPVPVQVQVPVPVPVQPLLKPTILLKKVGGNDNVSTPLPKPKPIIKTLKPLKPAHTLEDIRAARLRYFNASAQ